MSRNRTRVLFAALAAFIAVTVMEDGALASRGYMGSYAPPTRDSDTLRTQMLMDIGVQYVRDTKPDGGTDTAGRFSIGGMFNDWVGLDLQGLYQVRAKNYMVGGDLRIVPIDWFFLKAGVGSYASKDTHTLAVSPLAGGGIMAHITREVYLVTEMSYFSVNTHDNIGFGVGLGTSF